MLKDKDTQSKSKSSTYLATQSKQEQLIKLHKLTSYTRISTSSYTSKKIYMNVNTRLVIWRMQTTEKSKQS